MVSIIRSTSSDSAFQKLIAELDADLLHRYGAKQRQYDAHNTGLEGAKVVLALDEDRPVGCACYKVVEPVGTVEIKRMYVQNTSRRLGVAGQLLTALETWAKQEGHQAAILQTASKQPEAIALYQRCGYELTSCYGVYAADADSVCMKKALY